MDEPSNDAMKLEAAEYFINEARKFIAVTDEPPEAVVKIAEHELPGTGPWDPDETGGVAAPSSTEGDPERTEVERESVPEHDDESLKPVHSAGHGRVESEPNQETAVSESPDDGALTGPPERPAQERGGQASGLTGAVAAAPSQLSIVQRERLPIPSQIEGDPHEMPLDVTSADDRLIRRLHGEYGAFVARTTWLLSQAGSDLQNAIHLRDEAARDAVRRIPKMDDETGKAKLAMHISAERDEDPEVKKWDTKVRSHERDVEDLKALKEIYTGYVSRLSREMSMRNDEFSRGGR